MDDPCVICFEAMDMKSFEDERENTESCVKLECGHAYHTRCIIRCLSSMNQKCPNCNKNKTPMAELTREGIIRKLMREMRKDDDVKFLLGEYNESREELIEANKTLEKDVKKYIEIRKKELHIPEKRSYFMECISKLQGRIRSLAREKGPVYLGAMTADPRYRRWMVTSFEYNFFGRAQGYRNRRLKFPYLRMSLY